jgi:death-on-curing protein
VNVSYPDLEDYLAIAAEVTGVDLVTLLNATNLDLADSALHAPAAGFGDQALYPDLSTSQRSSSCVWPRITRCRMATSAQPG